MYGQTLINEAEVLQNWGPIISESTGIEDKGKVAWMSKYCHYHELYENNAYATRGSVNGMGATRFPADPGTQTQFADQATGSGDKPYTLLPLAMQVAAQTIGLDLVPVIPMPGPMGILTYMDYVYAGGKIGLNGVDGKGEDAPLLVEFDVTSGGTAAVSFTIGTAYVVNNGSGSTAAFTFVGRSRINNKYMFKVPDLGTTVSVADLVIGSTSTIVDGTTNAQTISSSASLVKGLENHVTGFSGSSYTSPDPYSREAGEKTQSNIMNLSLFNKSVEAKTFQVAAAVTREQVQDLKQFSIDAVAQVEAELINELTQDINKNILDRLFKLGNTNHVKFYNKEAVNFFLHIGPTATTIATQFPNFATDFARHDGGTTWAGTETIAATEANGGSSAENLHTRQRKIMSKVLAAANLIAIRGRRGPATFLVTNGQVASALQDTAGFVPAPMANTLTQQNGNLYPAGAISGVAVYVDPNMDWSDTRILVGRKGDGKSPGLVFMPYLMAESVETIAEGTMAPKIEVKSRYALVEAGFHPETMYITFGVSTDYGSLV